MMHLFPRAGVMEILAGRVNRRPMPWHQELEIHLTRGRGRQFRKVRRGPMQGMFYLQLGKTFKPSERVCRCLRSSIAT